MKKILITGKDSYIGTSFERWLLKEPDKYKVDTIDMKEGTWRKIDFSKFDVVVHLAGIAHIKETKKNRELYYKVNRDLAYEVAKKAKGSGVGQFIFLSTMSVYGMENGIIDRLTPTNPTSAYGKSKLEAEKLIKSLQDDSFIVSILRPPMVYGKGCKGNYSRLAKLALKTPIFPDIDNRRSMIYINNLTEFIKCLIDNGSGGLFFPQNGEYVNTSEMVKLIAKAHGKKIKMIKLLNPLLRRMFGIRTINKVFGDLVYEMNEDEMKIMNFLSFEKSIEITERI